MRLFRLQRLQFFLLAKLASDIAERNLRGLRICIEACRRILRRRGGTIIFPRALVPLGFDDRAIFWSEDVRAREIIIRVNMRGALLQFLLAGAFLAGGFGDALVLLILRAGNGCAESGAAQK